MKQSHVVVIIIFFSILWSTTRLGLLPDGLKAALKIEQMMQLEQSSTTNKQQFHSPTKKLAITRIMHHPFDNLTVISPKLDQPFPYSSFSCIQPMEEPFPNTKPSFNIYPDFVSRTCQFHNLYYNPHLRSFHYFVSPAEEKLKTQLEQNATASIQDIMLHQMTVSWSFIATKHVRKWLAVKRLRYGDWNYFQWHPKLHFESNSNNDHNNNDHGSRRRRWRDLSWSHQSNDTTASSSTKHVILLYHPSYSFNFGHFLLDDVATWFQMLFNFGHIHLDDDTSSTTITNSIPIPVMFQHKLNDALYRCSPSHKRWPTCVSMYQRLVPPLLHVQYKDDMEIVRTDNFLQELIPSPILVPRRHRWEYIRLEHVIVGSGRLAHYACDGSCSIGRVTWMPLFRQWMLQQLLLGESSSSLSSLVSPTTQRPLDSVADPAHDYITFSLPFNSTRGSGLSNFSDIIQAAQARYGPRRVQVVNLANMTLSEQAWLVLHSCIFVTYEGGGSHSSIFLPPGGTVVLYNSNSIYTRPKFQAFYRDRTWYDTMSQVQKVWVSAEDRNNVELAMSIFAFYMQ